MSRRFLLALLATLSLAAAAGACAGSPFGADRDGRARQPDVVCPKFEVPMPPPDSIPEECRGIMGSGT